MTTRSGGSSVRTPPGRKTRSHAIQTLVLVLIVLAVGALAGVGFIGGHAISDLGRAADRSEKIELANREINEAILARTAVDTDVLQAATPGNADAESSARDHEQEVAQSLSVADGYLQAAHVTDDLLADFRRVADSMRAFMATAVVFVNSLANNPAAITPQLAALQTDSLTLDSRLANLSGGLRAATDAARNADQRTTDAANTRILAATIGAVLVLIALAALIARRIRMSFEEREVLERATEAATEELRGQVSRQEFASELREALENADDEIRVLRVVSRALRYTGHAGPAELLLADSSRAHLRRSAHTEDGGGCQVTSPWECPAVRGGRTLVFESSKALRACPHLADRDGEVCSAICIPLLFNGRGMGVLHAGSSECTPPSSTTYAQLQAVAVESAMRIGTIRVLAKTQFQANTDGLTGLLNRRSLEEALREQATGNERFAVVMVDLDHFKLLNDTYGHEAGDRALRVFARLTREVFRGDDWAGRYGGEEFVIVLPSLSEREAKPVLERFRKALRAATEGGACPPVTASYGIADWQPGLTVDSVLALADARLLEAKAAGRDRIVGAGEDESAPVSC